MLDVDGKNFDLNKLFHYDLLKELLEALNKTHKDYKDEIENLKKENEIKTNRINELENKLNISINNNEKRFNNLQNAINNIIKGNNDNSSFNYSAIEKINTKKEIFNNEINDNNNNNIKNNNEPSIINKEKDNNDNINNLNNETEIEKNNDDNSIEIPKENDNNTNIDTNNNNNINNIKKNSIAIKEITQKRKIFQINDNKEEDEDEDEDQSLKNLLLQHQENNDNKKNILHQENIDNQNNILGQENNNQNNILGQENNVQQPNISQQENNLQQQIQNIPISSIPINYKVSNDLINSLIKKISSSQKRIKSLEKTTDQLLSLSDDIEILKKQFQKQITNAQNETKTDLSNINTKINDLNSKHESNLRKINECLFKCSDFDIFNTIQDSGNGTIDAAKILIRSVETKLNKRCDLLDEKIKDDQIENSKMKNNLTNFENYAQNIQKVNEDIKEDINNIKEKIDNNFKKNNSTDEMLENYINNNKDMIDGIDKKCEEYVNALNDKEKLIYDEINKLRDDIINNINNNNNDNNINNDNNNINAENEKRYSELRKKINELENELKLFINSSEIENIKNNIKDMKFEIEKKITTNDLKELYDYHLNERDEISDLNDRFNLLQEELKKNSSNLQKLLNKIEILNGIVNMIQTSPSSTNYNNLNSSLSKIDFNKLVNFDALNENNKNFNRELDKIRKEISSVQREIDEIETNIRKNYAKNDNLMLAENNLSSVINDFKILVQKKYVDKIELNKTVKNLEIQINKIDNSSANKNGDNWLLAKRPVYAYKCASCESVLTNIDNSTKDEYLPWNKIPNPKNNYRMGEGFSKMLKMYKNDFINNNYNSDDDAGNNSNIIEINYKKNNTNSNKVLTLPKVNISQRIHHNKVDSGQYYIDSNNNNVNFDNIDVISDEESNSNDINKNKKFKLKEPRILKIRKRNHNLNEVSVTEGKKSLVINNINNYNLDNDNNKNNNKEDLLEEKYHTIDK